MDILYLSIMFLVTVVIAWLKKSLFVVMIRGTAATIILSRVDLRDAAVVLGRQTVAWNTIDVLLSFYLTISLQLMLEKKERLIDAKDPFSRLLRDRGMNTIVSLAIVEPLPSVAVMITYVDMIDRTHGGYIDDKNETFVSYYYRHIPEMSLPTFPAVLLGLTLNGQNTGVLAPAIIPVVVTACLVVYITHLEGVPRGMPLFKETTDKKAEIIDPVKNLWTLVAVLLVITIFNLSVCITAPLVIASNYIFDHSGLKNLPNLMARSAEPILLGNMYLTMPFKGMLSYTDVIELPPDFIGQFPISMTMSFSLLFFIGTVTSGSQTIIAPCMPMASLAFLQGGIPFLIMLMSVTWAAVQIPPTYICSFVVANFYHTTLGDIVVRALGPVIIFSVIAYGYGLLLGQIFY